MNREIQQQRKLFVSANKLLSSFSRLSLFCSVCKRELSGLVANLLASPHTAAPEQSSFIWFQFFFFMVKLLLLLLAVICEFHRSFSLFRFPINFRMTLKINELFYPPNYFLVSLSLSCYSSTSNPHHSPTGEQQEIVFSLHTRSLLLCVIHFNFIK